MRRVTMLSLAFTFIFSVASFAQQPPVAVPDVTSSNWTTVDRQVVQVDLTPDGSISLKYLAVMYEDSTKALRAIVFSHEGNDFAMLFGNSNDNGSGVSSAIKVGGKWHLGKEKGVDKLLLVVVRDRGGKPTGLKATLETVDGPKEVVLPLK